MRFKTLLAASAAAAAISCTAKREAPAVAPAVRAAAPPVQQPVPAPADPIDPKRLKPFLPTAATEAKAAPQAAKIALGRAMFYDARLSRNGSAACSSCHTLGRARIDGQTRTQGADGRGCIRGTCDVSTPATPDQRALVASLQRIPRYAQLFANAFPDEQHPMTSKHVGDALIAFERALAPESRWARYVRGETTALSAAEKNGLKAFLDAGCQSCHSGPDLGGTMFQKLGAAIPWPHQTLAKAGKAPPADRLVKVRALKIAALYARYFRDSTSTRLRDSIEKMGYHQLGIKLADEDIAAIMTWMQSLTGELDAAQVAPPDPASERNVANLP
jgi:cytochrome c peroxidase